MQAVANEFDRKSAYQRFAITFVVVLTFVFAAQFSETNIFLLFNPEGVQNASQMLSSLLQPDFSGEFLQRIVMLSFESLYIGILGTLFGALFGVLLAVIGARLPNLPDPPGKSNFILNLLGHGIQSAARFLLIFFRAIPDVVWAYLFVMILGLGPGPAVIAIALATCGIVGKLFAELAESVDARLVQCVRSVGTGRWGAWWHCVFPQVKRQWVAYALFRMECNIRSGTILGVVGAGGLGSEIALSIRYFEYDKLATALMAILVFVILLEMVSAFLRNRPLKWTMTFAAVGGTVSLMALPIPWAQFFTSSPALSLGIGHLEFSWDFVFNAFSLSIETLLMAWCATLAAAVCAFLVAPLATSNLVTGSYLQDSRLRRGREKIRAWLTLSGARFLLQIFRAMPELTFALIFVVWVGPGPFAGVLAIAAHTFGVLGRLYTDVYEEVEHPPPAALQSGGVSGFGVWMYGVLPQVFPRLLAFTLYRFEVNVRATATVGFVGAGGIGDALHSAISLFHFADLIVLLGVLISIVVFVDFIGSRIRLRILTRDQRQTNRIYAEDSRVPLNEHAGMTVNETLYGRVRYKAKNVPTYLPAIPYNVIPQGVQLISKKPLTAGESVTLQVVSTEQEIPLQIEGCIENCTLYSEDGDIQWYVMDVVYSTDDSELVEAIRTLLANPLANGSEKVNHQYQFS